MPKKIRITQIKSVITAPPKHRLTIQAIGFKRTYQTLEKNDTPQLRGMIHQVRYMIRIEEGDK